MISPPRRTRIDPTAEAVKGGHKRPVRIQAAAVGGDDDLGEQFPELAVARQLPELRPGTAVSQGAVFGDVEGADAVTEGLRPPAGCRPRLSRCRWGTTCPRRPW